MTPRAARFPALPLCLVLAACTPHGPGPAQDTGATQTPAAAVPADPTANPQPVGNPNIQATLHAGFRDEALPVFVSMGQGWVAAPDGKPRVLCVRNKDPKRAALVSVSLQGKDINLNPAHPTRPLWRLEPSSARCFPEFVAKMDQPTIVAWHGFFAEGQDGAVVRDSGAKPAFSGFLRLGTPHDGTVPKAWPGLAVASPKPAATPPATAASPPGQ